MVIAIIGILSFLKVHLTMTKKGAQGSTSQQPARKSTSNTGLGALIDKAGRLPTHQQSQSKKQQPVDTASSPSLAQIPIMQIVDEFEDVQGEKTNQDLPIEGIGDKEEKNRTTDQEKDENTQNEEGKNESLVDKLLAKKTPEDQAAISELANELRSLPEGNLHKIVALLLFQQDQQRSSSEFEVIHSRIDAFQTDLKAMGIRVNKLQKKSGHDMKDPLDAVKRPQDVKIELQTTLPTAADTNLMSRVPSGKSPFDVDLTQTQQTLILPGSRGPGTSEAAEPKVFADTAAMFASLWADDQESTK